VALVGLSMMQWQRRDLRRAEHLLAEAEAMARTLNDAGGLAYARLHQGYVALFRDDFDLAAARAEEALSTCAAIPQEFSCHGALWLLARSSLARGENERALVLYERLLASARGEGDEISIANGLCALGMLAAQRDDWDRTLVCYAEAAAVCRDFGDRLFASGCLEGAAAAAVVLDRAELAVRLYAAVDIVRVTAGLKRIPGDHHQVAPQDHERALATARVALGAERFAAAWGAGASLSLDEAIAEALALARPVAATVPGRRAAPVGFTARERDVLRLLVGGMTDKEIAAALGIGRRTVSSHVEAIRAKLDAPSRTAAVAIAMRDRLV
jgi:non-specific serine/threonine protein kinase